MYNNIKTIPCPKMEDIYILEKGKYFIGDPTLVLPNSIYHGIWGNVHNYLPGIYSIFGNNLVIFHVKKGDDEYKDNIGNKYDIETGNISIVPHQLCDIDLESGSNIMFHEFADNVNIFYSKDGNLNIISSSTDIKINIGVDDDEDDNNSVDSFEKYLSKVQATEDEGEDVNEDDEYEENLLEDTNHQIPYNEESNYDNLTDSDDEDENEDNDFDTDDEDSEPQKRSFFITR